MIADMTTRQGTTRGLLTGVCLFAEEFQDSTENPHLTPLPAITIDTIDL